MDRVLTQILSQDDKVTATEAAKDSLTGLVNRFEFEKRLHQAITSAREEDTEHVMCYLDIDQFKMINNTLGTDVGTTFCARRRFSRPSSPKPGAWPDWEVTSSDCCSKIAISRWVRRLPNAPVEPCCRQIF